jgi:hypothetical protein
MPDGSNALPDVGDLSVCAYCFSFLQFDEHFALNVLTDAEVGALPDYARIGLQRLRRVLQKLSATQQAAEQKKGW